MKSLTKYGSDAPDLPTEAQKITYAAMYILKKIDLKAKDGGEDVKVMAAENTPIEHILDELSVHGLIEIHKRSGLYRLTQAGKDYIGALIDEASAYVDEFDDEETEDMLEELEARNLDAFRVRFLWGWFEGEFDNVALFQQRRGFADIERSWQYFIVDDAFYENLALDLEVDE